MGIVVFVTDGGIRSRSVFGAIFFYPDEILFVNCVFAGSVEDGHAGNFFDEGKFQIFAVFWQFNGIYGLVDSSVSLIKEKSTDLNSGI